MDSKQSLFDYIYVDCQAPRDLFLFHGTGGTKSDFLFLRSLLHDQYNLVGLQGNVSEEGMRRFFKRSSPGVFDQESIKEESDKLNQFILWWKEEHPQRMTSFLGYSNGANILLSTLFYYPQVMKNVFLLHPMLPFVPKEVIPLASHRIIVTMGDDDPLVSSSDQELVIQTLKSNNAQLTVKTYPTGHQISEQELRDISSLLTYH